MLLILLVACLCGQWALQYQYVLAMLCLCTRNHTELAAQVPNGVGTAKEAFVCLFGYASFFEPRLMHVSVAEHCVARHLILGSACCSGVSKRSAIMGRFPPFQMKLMTSTRT